MENTLEKIDCLERYEKIKEQGYTAHDYQTTEFVQSLIPFLRELQSIVKRQETEIDRLQNRVEQLDRLSNY